jgi:UDP-N-acetylmuramoyl-L-alanyl-D-glutamate--2,6-diaminopimelate ligase
MVYSIIDKKGKSRYSNIMKEALRKIIPRFVLDIYYWFVEFFAALLHGFPGMSLRVIGVTGTKGKSTTVYLITRILEEAGLNIASNSSIELRIAKKSLPNSSHLSTPSRMRLQQFLTQAKKKKCKYVVLEVTSEGLVQHRLDFIRFCAAILTNITPEHIESHGSFENYKRAKKRLFTQLNSDGIAVINKDDREYDYFASAHKGKTIPYSLEKQKKPLHTSLIGQFNQYNILAASTVCRELGVSDKVIQTAIKGITVVPGRAEEIKEGQDFRVFVDYAYNTSSLEAILNSLSKFQIPNSKLITLTGSAGGGRDVWRRPEMGRIAAELSDKVVITSEDSYNEDPAQIIAQVKAGAQKVKRNGKKVDIYTEVDRKKGIEKALSLAKKNDIVLIAGMGSEPSLMTPKGEIPWDERGVVRKILKLLINH